MEDFFFWRISVATAVMHSFLILLHTGRRGEFPSEHSYEVQEGLLDRKPNMLVEIYSILFSKAFLSSVKHCLQTVTLYYCCKDTNKCFFIESRSQSFTLKRQVSFHISRVKNELSSLMYLLYIYHYYITVEWCDLWLSGCNKGFLAHGYILQSVLQHLYS